LRPSPAPIAAKPVSGRGATALERKRLADRLEGFNFKTSLGWQAISTHFGETLTQTELLSVAKVIGSELGINIDREAKRRKEVLVKWFDEHYEHLSEILPRITLEDDSGKRMDGASSGPK
jgi:hypothetical protein